MTWTTIGKDYLTRSHVCPPTPNDGQSRLGEYLQCDECGGLAYCYDVVEIGSPHHPRYLCMWREGTWRDKRHAKRLLREQIKANNRLIRKAGQI